MVRQVCIIKYFDINFGSDFAFHLHAIINLNINPITYRITMSNAVGLILNIMNGKAICLNFIKG